MQHTFVEKLAESNKDKKCGNHRLVLESVPVDTRSNITRKYIYHNTVICQACENLKIFYVDASWDSVSTTQACNAYRNYYLNKEYTEVTQKVYDYKITHEV